MHWLSALTFVRVCYPIFLTAVGFSIRIDFGESACLIFGMFYATTYYMCLPKTRHQMFFIFGADVFRLLGWNHPALFCAKCVGGGVAAGCVSLVVREGYFIVDDASRARQYKSDCGMVATRNLLVDEIRVKDPVGYAEKRHQYTPVPEIPSRRSYLFGGNINVQNNIGIKPKGVIAREVSTKNGKPKASLKNT